MGRDKTQGLSIFYRLLIAFLSVVTVVAGIVTAVFFGFSRESLHRHAKEEIKQHFEAIIYQFRDELGDDLKRELRLLASNPVLDEFMMSSEFELEINARAVERLFMEYIRNTESHHGISYVDYTGMERVRVDRTGRVRAFRDLGKSELFARIESGSSG